jgi:hypothetical protein
MVTSPALGWICSDPPPLTIRPHGTDFSLTCPSAWVAWLAARQLTGERGPSRSGSPRNQVKDAMFDVRRPAGLTLVRGENTPILSI